MLLYFAALIGMIKQGLLITLLLITNSFAFSQYSIPSVPDPKNQGQDYFVSDPDGILGYDVVDSLNKLCASIEKVSSAEVAIVAINDFKGSSDFDFAYRLFNHWGIGKAESNNGLLLFIAKDRRKYQFITGYGMEGRLPDVTLGAIGENYLVPKFRESDYGGGVIDAMNAIKNILSAPDSAAALKAEIRKFSFWYKNGNVLIAAFVLLVVYFFAYRRVKYVIGTMKLGKARDAMVVSGCAIVFFIFFVAIFGMSIIGSRLKIIFTIGSLPYAIIIIGSLVLLVMYGSARKLIIDGYKDKETLVNKLVKFDKMMLLPMLLSPLAFLSLFLLAKQKKELRRRLVPPDDSGKWQRVNKGKKEGISKYLDKGQLKEEKMESVSYEVWKHNNTSAIKLVAWPGKNYRKYEVCPKCNCRTLSKVYTQTLKSPTYSKSGMGEKMQSCQACDYKQSFGTVILPMLVRESSSSGSSSGSSGGSSSSSSGGSWGGGSSGGGGAGGSW